ncbi:ABC transporter ATP-binding protein [Prochlorococcus sp. MIT 1341]|uniref:ABC transporter ATP-binding protein n=1 Tax=Prochlorococcus sp. MIT 1341 TaxID=3096221 RepID=UPI002A753938|nr:ABC transporter ATP-binding protein [Prochlorococcus sp. MIT 1341]
MNSFSNESFTKILKFLRPHFRRLTWGLVCMLIYVCCWPILAWLAGKLIPAIGEGNLLHVVRVISFALVIFLLQKLAQFGQDTLLAGPALFLSQELRRDLFRKLQKVDLGSLQKLSSGDLTYRLTEDADRVGEVVYKTIQDTTPSVLQLIAVFSYMVVLDWQTSLATLLLAPLVALLVSQFGAKVLKAAEKSQIQVSDLAGLLGEAIQGLPLVRAFAAESWLQERFDQEVEQHRKARYKTLRLLALQHPVVGFIEAAGILTVLAIGTIRIQSGDLNAEGFSSYVAALLMLIDPISHLTTNFNEFQQGKASLKRLKDLENQPQEPSDVINPETLKIVKGDLKINQLSFYYEAGNPILKEVNLEIKSGQITALVGPSGAGKSTLFSLLLRFIVAQKGEILLDNQNITQIKVSDLRRHFALVPQKPTVFSGTIEDAIRFGRKASKAEIIKAAEQANANDFIKKLSKGYSSRIEEGGANLSGGQLQRIAIARAILGNPSVLLLDEATSALDAESEEAVQLALRRAMKGRTVLVIAHRLATVQEADQIIVIDKGEICEKGTHDELIKKAGRYRELCEKQIIRDLDK